MKFKITWSQIVLIYLLLVVAANTFGWWTDNSVSTGWLFGGGTCVRVNTNGTPYVNANHN